MDYFDAYGNPRKPKSAGAILPLLLVVLASGGANYWLWKERAKTMADANAATGKLAAAEAAQKEMTEKLEKLEAERTGLIEAKEQAVKDAQARALELAKLKDDVAGVEVTKEPEADTKDDAKADAKADKKAGGKAETKAKTKAKAKKKTAERSHKAKKEGGGSTPSEQREL